MSTDNEEAGEYTPFQPILYLDDSLPGPLGLMADGLNDDNAAGLRPEVTLGTDRRLAEEPNWDSFSSTALHAMATTGNDPAIGHDLARTWTALGNRIGELSHRLLTAQGRMIDSWAGQDAQLAARAVVSTARFAIDTGRAAQFMGTRIGDEAYAAEAAKRMMPPPQELDPAAELQRTLTEDSAPVDVAAAAEQARITKDAQIRVMSSFHGSSVDVDSATPVFSAPTPVTTAGAGGHGGAIGAGGGAGLAPAGWPALPAPGGGPAAPSGVPGSVPPTGPGSGGGAGSPGVVGGPGALPRGAPAGGLPGRAAGPGGLSPITTPSRSAPAGLLPALPGGVAGGWNAGSGNDGSGTGSSRYPGGGSGFPAPGYSPAVPGYRSGRSGAFGSPADGSRPGTGWRNGPGGEGGSAGRAAPGGSGSAAGRSATGAGMSRGAAGSGMGGAPMGMGGGAGTGGGREHRRPSYLLEDRDVWAVNLPYTEPVLEP